MENLVLKKSGLEISGKLDKQNDGWIKIYNDRTTYFLNKEEMNIIIDHLTLLLNSKEYVLKNTSKQLKIGDTLLVKDVNDWCREKKNEFLVRWGIADCPFAENELTISDIQIKDGHKAFLICNSHHWIRAKGFRKFCKKNKKP